MVSEREATRLRAEANAILTRIHEVEEALERARTTEGDHWESGTVELSLEQPEGGEIEVELDLETEAAENASDRFERAKEIEQEVERKRQVEGPLAEAPDDPLFLEVMTHLDAVEGDYPRSMAGVLGVDRERVRDVCAALERAGLLERIESGMLKRRKVKLKRSNETHQHHTYYRLSRAGDHLLRDLDERETREAFLRKFDDALRIARRISDGGPDYPRMTADALDMDRDRVRRLYGAMATLGLAETYDGATIKGTERKLKPKDETHRKHTYYVTTDAADRILREIAG